MSPRRVQIAAIPDYPKVCTVPKMCPYRGLTATTAVRADWCEEPRTNKGNSDAACHRMNNKDLLKHLENRP
jgi:hypothetical protein